MGLIAVFIICTFVLFWRHSRYPVQCTGAVTAPGPGSLQWDRRFLCL